ncbi:DMT family transporter [Ihubacter sp. mB4P-1]|uniref:DMT family transporter n=1 Tax=Ihubacter sp. mB4P-1 TaxID=3242370 RepID=UPI00137B837E
MRKHFNKGYIYVFIAGCLWGTLGLFVNFLGGYGISGATVVFLRMSTATLWIIPVILATGGTRLLQIDGKGLLVCAVLGIVCQALFNYAYTEAISSIGIATAAVLLYTSPVFVSIMSRIFFKETIGARKVAGLFINIVGCALTVTGGNLGTVDFLGYGVLIGIAAGFLYSLLTIFGTIVKDYDTTTVTFYSFLFAAVTMGFTANPWSEMAAALSPSFVVTAFAYGLITAVVAYFVYMRGLSMNLETSKVPVIASVETVVAAIIGFAVFQEDISFGKVVGIGLVLASIAIMNLRGSQKA